MTDRELRELVERIAGHVESMASNADRMAEAAAVFSDAATRILETMVASQQQTAKAIAATIKRTGEARGLLEDYQRRRDGETRGAIRRAADGQVVELPKGGG